MIDRYIRQPIRDLWDIKAKYRRWLEVEILAAEAWSKLGQVPPEAVAAMRAHQDEIVDQRFVARVDEIEAEVQHDVIAFTTAVSERLGDPGRYIHYGLTSYDVVDTALAVAMRDSVDVILADMASLREVLRQKAKAHKHTVMIGRTHGVHAEPITFGLKLALWDQEVERAMHRLQAAREEVAVGKISGPVGTYAHVDPFVEQYVCSRLGLKPAPVSSQIIQRDRHAFLLEVLALWATSLEKFTTEIRALQRTEIREVEEPFRAGQKGSSAMPHKRNPWRSERIAGLARLVRGYALAAVETVPLWGERDISNSSVERVALPDAIAAVDFMTVDFQKIMNGLLVYPDRMRANLEATGGLVFSERVLLALVEKGLRREDAYRIVQENAMAAWAGGPSFRDRIAADPRVRERLDAAALEGLFDPHTDLLHVDDIFRRLGLD